jgi:hypothetical protein
MIKKKEFQTKYIELPSSFPFPKFSFDWVWQNVTEKELDFFREVLKCNEKAYMITFQPIYSPN